MINMKKVLIGGAAVLALSTLSITAFAADYNSPAEAAAGVTGKTIEQVASERQAGKSYGSIAAEADKLEEFQQAMTELHKDRLDARVADGALSRDRADELLDAMRERQAVCNGMGYAGAGRGFGHGGGYGRGRGMGMQSGFCPYR